MAESGVADDMRHDYMYIHDEFDRSNWLKAGGPGSAIGKVGTELGVPRRAEEDIYTPRSPMLCSISFYTFITILHTSGQAILNVVAPIYCHIQLWLKPLYLVLISILQSYTISSRYIVARDRNNVYNTNSPFSPEPLDRDTNGVLALPLHGSRMVSYPSSPSSPLSLPIFHHASSAGAELTPHSNIHLKLDLLQPSSSFKSRGIGHLISLASQKNSLTNSLSPPPPGGQVSSLHFYCSSGGNAGLACATACLTLGHPCTIVVPMTTTDVMVAKLRALEAEVKQHGRNWAEADRYLREEVMGEDMKWKVYVPPFDHPDIWEGASSLVPEMEQQMQQFGGYDGVVCSVGGGGLLIGIAEGIAQSGLSNSRKILAVETEGGESLSKSLLAGGVVTLPSISTIATSLGCSKVAKRAFEVAQRENVEVAVLSDAQAGMGCVHLADMERLMVEAACGVSVATCFDGTLRSALGRGLTDAEWKEKRVVIIVCGGSIVSTKLLEDYREKYQATMEQEIKMQKNRLVKDMLRGMRDEGLVHEVEREEVEQKAAEVILNEQGIETLVAAQA